MLDNKKPVHSEEQAQNKLEKTYENKLKSGGTLTVHITLSVDGYQSDDFSDALKKFATSSHNFYLEFGKRINNTL